MKPLDQLLIRACKTIEPRKRLISVYKRFYGRYDIKDEQYENYLLQILMYVVKEHCPIEPDEIVYEFFKTKQREDMFGAKQSDVTIFYNIFISHVRFTEISKLRGLISPRRFR